jgi:hypothetical protein
MVPPAVPFTMAVSVNEKVAVLATVVFTYPDIVEVPSVMVKGVPSFNETG